MKFPGPNERVDAIRYSQHDDTREAIYFMHHNVIRIQPSTRVTSAMAAKGTEQLWSMDDVVAMVEAKDPPPKKRSPCEKRQPAAA